MSDPDQPSSAIGAERASALNDLKADLFSGVSAYASVEGMPEAVDPSLAYLSHPNYDDTESPEIHRMLFDIIEIQSDDLKNHPHLAMAGDPERVLVKTPGQPDTEYYYVARKNALAPLQVLAKKVGVSKAPQDDEPVVGLLTEDYDVLRYELTWQFDEEFKKNSAAISRGRDEFNNDPGSVSLGEAVQTEKVRGVSATTLDRASILALHPELDAIEDLKIISMLSYIDYYDALAEYRDALVKIGEESQRYLVVLIPSDKQVKRPRNLNSTTSEKVRASKTVIAEIYDSETDVIIEVVEKLNEYAFPIDQKLEGIIPHVVDGKNVLPVYSQIVLRVKRDRTTVGEVQNAQEETGIYVPKGMSTAAMQIDVMRSDSSEAS